MEADNPRCDLINPPSLPLFDGKFAIEVDTAAVSNHAAPWHERNEKKESK
jgi:hypothetical protein